MSYVSGMVRLDPRVSHLAILNHIPPDPIMVSVRKQSFSTFHR